MKLTRIAVHDQLIKEGDDGNEDNERDWRSSFSRSTIEKIGGSRQKHRRIQDIIEKRDSEGAITILDRWDNPIKKLDKEFPALDVLESYISANQIPFANASILDMNSSNGIWGIVSAHNLPDSTVKVLHDPEKNGGRSAHLMKNLDANPGLHNITLIKRHDFETEKSKYDLILLEVEWSNSPKYIFNQIAKLWDTLSENGKVALITHKNLGAETLIQSLIELGLEAEIKKRGRGGVRVIEIQKTHKLKHLPPIDTREKHLIQYKDINFDIYTDESVFSREGVDGGTEFLLDTVIATYGVEGLKNKRVGDFGSGWGTISIILSKVYGCNIVGFENNERSVSVSQDNFSSLGVPATLIDTDITNPKSDLIKEHTGSLDVIVTNPPFHVTDSERKYMLKNMKTTLKQGGDLWMVVEQGYVEKFSSDLQQMFSITSTRKTKDSKYTVFHCKK